MKDVVLAVDIGTSSLKAGLICQDGTVIAMTSVPYSAPENRFVAEGWIWALKAAVDAAHLGLGHALLGLSRRFEDAQSVELHGNTHGQQLGQAARHHGEDGLNVLQSILTAMGDHVLCEATGGEGLQSVYHRIELTVPGRGLVGVLSEVDSQNGIVN